MKKNKQMIISFPGNEEDIMYLREIAKRTDRGLSWHIRKAIELYVDDIVGKTFELNDNLVMNEIESRINNIKKNHNNIILQNLDK